MLIRKIAFVLMFFLIGQKVKDTIICQKKTKYIHILSQNIFGMFIKITKMFIQKRSLNYKNMT